STKAVDVGARRYRLDHERPAFFPARMPVAASTRDYASTTGVSTLLTMSADVPIWDSVSEIVWAAGSPEKPNAMAADLQIKNGRDGKHVSAFWDKSQHVSAADREIINRVWRFPDGSKHQPTLPMIS